MIQAILVLVIIVEHPVQMVFIIFYFFAFHVIQDVLLAQMVLRINVNPVHLAITFNRETHVEHLVQLHYHIKIKLAIHVIRNVLILGLSMFYLMQHIVS